MIENSLLLVLIGVISALSIFLASKLMPKQDKALRIPVRMDDDIRVRRIVIYRK